MNFLKKLSLAMALLGCSAVSLQAAEISLHHADASGVAAVIVPDAQEMGTSTHIYIAALVGDHWFLRDGAATTNWVHYQGGSLPVALSGQLLSAATVITLVDFDVSMASNLDLYVGYGNNEVDLFKAGHLAKVYSSSPAPTLPVTSNIACDPAVAPAGISYVQNGNHISVTTQGQCVAVPTGGLCAAPAQAQATGISVLVTTQANQVQMNGISFLIPGLPNPFESIGAGLANSKTCLQNAPADFGNYGIDVDVCYDITNRIDPTALQSAGAFVTVTPPITIQFQGAMTNATVADCFATDAASITDAYTHELWIKQADGSFKKP